MAYLTNFLKATTIAVCSEVSRCFCLCEVADREIVACKYPVKGDVRSASNRG